MNDCYIPVHEAVKRSSGNSGSKWPSRREPNRLEPNCWPVIHPKFEIESNAKIFTMGSCFARNIEMHLANMGFHVPTVEIPQAEPGLFKSSGPELLNLYTPSAMAQELLWTRNIFDRDDNVREEDVLPLLLHLDGDRYIDLHTSVGAGLGHTIEQQIERRRIIYRLNREAFHCDIAILTLGLIETWWDLQTGQSIEFSHRIVRHPEHKRFAFRRMRYEEAYAAIEQTVNILLRDFDRRLMITTSPVPLSVTFSDDDVITANMYSKSVLRAVAGAIAERNNRIDYFPSFESVMLTGRSEVWMDDLIHVQQSFIGQIMARVVAFYVDGDTGSKRYQEVAEFSHLVQAEKWREAKPYYNRLWKPGAFVDSRQLALTLAIYELANGLRERCRSHLECFVDDACSGPPPTCVEYFIGARVHRELGEPHQAEEISRVALEQLGKNPVLLNSAIVELILLKLDVEANWLIRAAEIKFSTDYVVLNLLSKHRNEAGQHDESHRLRRAAFEVADEPRSLCSYSQELMDMGDLAGAIGILQRYQQRSYNAVVARKLSTVLLKHGQLEEAELTLKRWLLSEPGEAIAFGMLAVIYASTGRPEMALSAGRVAMDLGTDMPNIRPMVERLSKRLQLAKLLTCP